MKATLGIRQVFAMIVVAAIAILLVAATATHVLAAKNLNSSKSNIYRQSTHQNQTIEGGSGEQISSNTCTCTSNDITVINGGG